MSLAYEICWTFELTEVQPLKKGLEMGMMTRKSLEKAKGNVKEEDKKEVETKEDPISNEELNDMVGE